MTRVLYTGRGGQIAAEIFRAGHEVTCQRVIRHQSCAGALERISELLATGIDWVTITSVTSAGYLAEIAEYFGDVRIASGGPATTRACQRAGLTVAWEASKPGGSRPLAAGLPAGAGSRILVITSALTDDWLAGQFAAQGHWVDRVDLYTTLPDPEGLDQVAAGWPSIEIAVISSPSSARALSTRVDLNVPRLVVALGERTSAELTAMGLAHRVSQGTTGADICRAIEGDR